MTEPVTITVADVVSPAEGRKQGKIIDTTGKKWNVWADKLANYQRGATYRIDNYKTNQFNGQTFYVIDKAVSVGATPAGSAPFLSTTPYTKASGEDPQRSEDIAVLAIVKEWVGKIPVGDTAALVHALRTARVAWRNSKVIPNKIETGIPPKEDFNDALPENFR